MLVKESIQVVKELDSIIVQKLNDFYKDNKKFILNEIRPEGSFYSLDLTVPMDSDTKDLEEKRFIAFKAISEAKQELLGYLVDENYNVINIVVKKYQLTKDSSEIRIVLTALISQTNIKDYVSGRTLTKDQLKDSQLTTDKDLVPVQPVKKEMKVKDGKLVNEKSNKNPLGVKSSIKEVASVLKRLYEVAKKEVEEEETPIPLDDASKKQLDKAIQDYMTLSEQIEQETTQFEKTIKTRVEKALKLKGTIEKVMTDFKLAKHETDSIVAKLSKQKKAPSTTWKKVFLELLEKVCNEFKQHEAKIQKWADKIQVDNTKDKFTPPSVSVNRKDESIKKTGTILKEGSKEDFIQGMKEIYSSFKGFVSNLHKYNYQLETLLSEI